MREHRRSRAWLALPVTGALLFLLAGVARGQVTLPAGTVIKAGDTTYENKDIIVDGGTTGTATIDGSHTFNSLIIKNNGVVTHDPPASSNFAGGMILVIAKNCTINTGSAINVTGKGWAGGTASLPAAGPGAGGNDALGGTGGGGSYGGEGANGSGGEAGMPYDDLSLKTPTDLGSGGGSSYNGAWAGGSGGGALQLKVGGTLQVDGQILADGQSVDGGGGSGGSIYLTVGTVSGAGVISASGGSTNVNRPNAGGSGGRIALYYKTNNFAVPLTTTGYKLIAAGGGTSNNGYSGAGTVFLQNAGQKQGDLWIHNTGHSSSNYTPLWDPFSFDNIYVAGGAVLTSLPGIPLTLNVSNNVTVTLDGIITVSGRGYAGGFGPFPAAGPGAGESSITGLYGGGGAYGGEGADGSGGQGGFPYDDLSLKTPTDLGSGGGSSLSGLIAGGAGGGAIQLTAGGTLQVDGHMTADGPDETGPAYGGGGGSGGSIYLTVGTLSGAGVISASGSNTRGGIDGSTWPGPGSGGRIAIYYKTNSFAVPLTTKAYKLRAAGGIGSAYYGQTEAVAGAGTLFLKQTGQTQGELWIHNVGVVEGYGAYGGPYYTPLTNPQTFDNIYIWGKGVLSSDYGLPLNLQVLGTLDIGIDGAVNVVGRGYPGGYGAQPAGGPGAGASDVSGVSGGGGSYGGVGVDGGGGANKAGPTYGSATMPVDLGSGGGSGNYGTWAGGGGGGAIHALINGTAQIDGQLVADGTSGSGGGAGSGGSIWLVTNTLSGGGLISTAGGSAVQGGVGGGGGRIAIYVAANSMAKGTIRASGGSGAGAGTVNVYAISAVSLQSLTVATPTLAEGSGTTTGSVTLSGKAPAGGITIALKTSNSMVASVPPSVTVPAGQKGATFSIAAKPLSLTSNVTISASLGGRVQTVTLNVQPWIAGIGFAPAVVPGGATSTGTVTLNFPAPQGGLTVGLVSGNAVNAQVPATITVPQGATTATFSITTSSAVTNQNAVTITATYGPESLSKSITINPSTVQLKSFVLSPTAVVGGNISIGLVTLNGKAPAGGASIALSSANPGIVQVPAQINVPQGRSVVGFVITTPQVTTAQSVVLSATHGATTKTATLQIQPTGIATLTLLPNVVMGGVETSLGIVTLQYAVPTDTVVTIKSSNLLAIPDATLTIPAGSLTGFFDIDTQTNSTSTAQTAVITATVSGISATATLTIN